MPSGAACWSLSWAQPKDHACVRHTIMQQVIILFLLILCFLYCLLLMYYRRAWKQIAGYEPQTPNLKPTTRISVIIPARNEETHIGACLDSLANQSYPKELFEVLVVDDHSTDNTAAIIDARKAGNIKRIALQDHINGETLNSYKKKAIETAIRLSTGELIVTTDADCVVPPHWLQTIAAFYAQYQPAFIAAPVRFLPSPGGEGPGVRFIEIFQSLDFMTLQGITGASVYKKTHSMCNGANMAYTRKAFEEVGGFAGIDSIASGDDMLLMHKIYKRNPSKIMFLKSREAIVETAPVNSIRAFFNQRIRWASKATQYEDKRIFGVLLLVYLFNLSLLALPIAGLFSNPTFNLHLYPVSIRMTLLECWVILLLTKLIVELWFLLPVAQFFGKRNMLWFFPLMQPLHILYTVIAGWFGQFGRYTWKQRSVK